MNPVFKKSLLLSVLGHFTVFSLFGFSFGARIPDANYAAVSFWGDILLPAELIPACVIKGKKISMPRLPLSSGAKREAAPIGNIYFKPQAQPLFITEKPSDIARPQVLPPLTLRKSEVVMLYPQLPTHFLLYFQDRQAVHIELEFKIISGKRANVVAVQRKISSGNLEADLLAMRYIKHYLFIQQGGFPRDRWQTVKIDLSAKEQRQPLYQND